VKPFLFSSAVAMAAFFVYDSLVIENNKKETLRMTAKFGDQALIP